VRECERDLYSTGFISSLARSLPPFLSLPPPERRFGVDKVLVVVLHNLHRLPRLLDVAMRQLSLVALHRYAKTALYKCTVTLYLHAHTEVCRQHRVKETCY
jgi:hypothetical protein